MTNMELGIICQFHFVYAPSFPVITGSGTIREVLDSRMSRIRLGRPRDHRAVGSFHELLPKFPLGHGAGRGKEEKTEYTRELFCQKVAGLVTVSAKAVWLSA